MLAAECERLAPVVAPAGARWPTIAADSTEVHSSEAPSARTAPDGERCSEKIFFIFGSTAVMLRRRAANEKGRSVTDEDAVGGPRVPDPRHRPRHDAIPAGADEEADDPARFSRRGFLGGTAGLAATVASLRLRSPALAARLEAEGAHLAAAPERAVEVPNLVPSLELSVERATDLVLLDFQFYGFKVATATKPRYLAAGANNVIVVQFPPQAIGEAAYFNDTSSGPLPTDPAPVLSVVSGPSRISFSLPPGGKIPLPTMTAADLLDWSGWYVNAPLGAADRRRPGRALPGRAGPLRHGGGVPLRAVPVPGRRRGELGDEARHPLLLPRGAAHDPQRHRGVVGPARRPAARGRRRLVARLRRAAGRLGAGRDPRAVHRLRAMSGYPPKPGQPGPTFQFTSTSQTDRAEIVEASGAPGATGHAFVQSSLFELSSLGASLDLTGHWSPPSGADAATVAPRSVAPISASIAQWRQVTTQGRDQYVRVVYRGYLFPLGLRAIFVKVVDRIFVPDPEYPNDHADAYLQLREFIRIVEPTKSYPALGQPFGANSWPFSSITAVTTVSPFLAPNPPALVTPPHGKPAQAILPQSVSGDVIWTFHAVDDDKNIATLQLPQAFVFGHDSSSYVNNPFDAGHYTTSLAKAWNKLDETRRSCRLPGTHLRLAPEVSIGKKGSTTHPVYSLELKAASTTLDPNTSHSASGPSTGSLSAADQPAFYPSLGHANIRIPAAEALSRQTLNDSSSITAPPGVQISYYPDYVAGGFPASLHPNANTRPALTPRIPGVPSNLGSVYSQLTSAATPVTMPADAVGGIAQPNLNVAGLSAAAGVLGGGLSSISSYASNGLAQIEDYFSGLTNSLGKIFGGLPFLGSLGVAGVDAAHPHLPNPGGILGQFVNTPLNSPEMQTAIDQATGTKTTSYTFAASLQPWNGGNSLSDPNLFQPDPGGQMTLVATATVSAKSPPTYEVNGTIDPFTVTILGSEPDLGFISIPFDTVTFTSGTGMKTDVNVQVGDVTFLSPLTFINQLEEFLQNLGGSGFSIDVTPTQVSASLTLAIPSVGGAVFTFENLALSAGITVPFLGDPTVATFAFCSQDAPFQITVDCIGGGGYATLALGMDGVQAVAASFDIAAEIALDLAVASGGVSLSAGFTYSWESSVGTTLSAFVRLCGEVEVIGLISVSIELEITLGLVIPNGGGAPYLTGTGTLKISVSVCFFSVTVPISVTKTFGPIAGIAAPHDADGALGSAPWTIPAMFASQVTSAQVWSDYCGAFAD